MRYPTFKVLRNCFPSKVTIGGYIQLHHKEKEKQRESESKSESESKRESKSVRENLQNNKVQHDY